MRRVDLSGFGRGVAGAALVLLMSGLFILTAPTSRAQDSDRAPAWGYGVFWGSKMRDPDKPNSVQNPMAEARMWHTPVIALGVINHRAASSVDQSMSSQFCKRINEGLSGVDTRVYHCSGVYFQTFRSEAEARQAWEKRMADFRRPGSKWRIDVIEGLTLGNRGPVTIAPPRASPTTNPTNPAVPSGPTAAELAAQRTAEEAAQRAATDRLNAETAQRDAATVARNEAAQRDFARRQAEHRRQLAAVEAEAARIRREAAAREQAYADQRRNWEAQVAACNRGDRAACAGQTPAAPAQARAQTPPKPPAAGPRQVYYFIYVVNGEHVGYVPAKVLSASELKAEEALVTRLAVERYGSGVRVLTVPVSRDAACSQLYLGGPNDKTYNLKTGSRESVEKGIAEQIRLNSGRAVSSIYCGG